MSLKGALDAIRGRAETLWPSLEPEVPLLWRGDDNGHVVLDDPVNLHPWLLFEIKWNAAASGFASIGSPQSNLARRYGAIWIHAFVPTGSGLGRAHELLDFAAGMFEGADFAGVICQAMEPEGEAESEDGAYDGQSAAVPFQFDDLK